jgi:hypothetical protein
VRFRIPQRPALAAPPCSECTRSQSTGSCRECHLKVEHQFLHFYPALVPTGRTDNILELGGKSSGKLALNALSPVFQGSTVTGFDIVIDNETSNIFSTHHLHYIYEVNESKLDSLKFVLYKSRIVQVIGE